MPPVQISETGRIVDANVQLEAPPINGTVISSENAHSAAIEPLGGSRLSPVQNASDDPNEQEKHDSGNTLPKAFCEPSARSSAKNLGAGVDWQGDKPESEHFDDDVAGRTLRQADISPEWITVDSELEIPKVLESLMSRYSREQLYDEIWTDPVWTVAKKYKVSDVALAKTCRKLCIPIPRRGYWSKLAANKPVEPRPMLPSIEVVQKLPRRNGRVHSPEEIRAILQNIQSSVSSGMTLSSACQEAQIDAETFRRWRKIGFCDLSVEM